MGERALVYDFEGISADLPRPPLAAMRALLSAGVLMSARAWQELPPDARHAISTVGAAEVVDDARLALLLKQVNVSQIKFIGRRPEPDRSAVPAELVSALGPVRPLTLGEWTGLRAVDRYVLVSLVKNSRLLAKALNEMLPQSGGAVNAGGVVVAWSGLVARAELRMRREVVQKATSSEFMGGRAFVLANVAGRRAARRASELLDAQAESTVGPVEIDWGLRAADDVLFWQAHVSAWDGTFFPVAAMLAATTAATAMHDMIRVFDPTASIVFAGVREEPWQAGREQLQEAATALFTKLGPIPMSPDDGRDTVRVEREDGLRESGPRISASYVDSRRSGPPPTSSPLVPATRPVGLADGPFSRGGPPSSAEGALSSRRPAKKRPAWVGVAVVGLVVLANLVVLFGIVVFLSRTPR